VNVASWSLVLLHNVMILCLFQQMVGYLVNTVVYQYSIDLSVDLMSLCHSGQVIAQAIKRSTHCHLHSL
jgi:hypothetical protein